MGNEFLRECKSCDHVGLKSCIGGRYDIRTEDKISKDRRGLCAAASLGIRKGGLNMVTCNLIYWSMIIPKVTYAVKS